MREETKDQLKHHPNWLRDVVYDAHISTMAHHDLQWHMQCIGGKYTVPIPEKEQEDLFKKLDSRFRSWTGKGFESWLRHRK